MNQNSWNTLGITSCKHKRELYTELQNNNNNNNNNATLASYYRDYSKILSTEILNAMNNTLLVGGIFCDLEKALVVSIMLFYYLN